MNIRNNILLSLLIGGLTFNVSAQKADPGPMPAVEDADVEPTEDADVELTEDADIQDAAEKPQQPQLHLQLNGDMLSLSGVADANFAVVLGLQLKTYPLPGGAKLHVDPLVVLIQGQFDATGDYEHSLISIVPAQFNEEITFYAQAVSESAGKYSTSNVLTIVFDGVSIYEKPTITSMVEVPTWVPQSQNAIRRQLVA